MNSLLEMLLPQAVRTARFANNEEPLSDNSIVELRRKLSLMANTTVGSLAKRDLSVIYPDSPLIDVLLLLDGGNEVAMVDRETRRFICMVSALDLLHTVNKAVGR